MNIHIRLCAGLALATLFLSVSYHIETPYLITVPVAVCGVVILLVAVSKWLIDVYFSPKGESEDE